MQLKRFISAMFLFSALIALYGCAAILEDSILIESPHAGTQYVRPLEERAVASNYGELKEALLDIVMQHEESGIILIQSYDGEIREDFDHASYEIKYVNPIGAYAVSEIVGVTTRIVTNIELEVSVEYKRTRQQVESIVTILSLQELSEELLNAMSEYSDELVIRSALRGVNAESVLNLARETYYNNPRSIVMMPGTAIDTFPDVGDDIIFVISFGHIPPANIQRGNAISLAGFVQLNAEAAIGENDAERLLSLAENLIGTCVFDEGAARTIYEHGMQNHVATAFGALVTGNAVGEGFAMAFKALCDELGIYCRVVLGYLDGMIHAWNIVSLDGDYYHIDVSMGALNGLETAFLKTDMDFIELYSWDFETTVSCQGELTYEDVVIAREMQSGGDPEEDVSQES